MRCKKCMLTLIRVLQNRTSRFHMILIPNLDCPKCGRQFRRGEIQKYRSSGNTTRDEQQIFTHWHTHVHKNSLGCNNYDGDYTEDLILFEKQFCKKYALNFTWCTNKCREKRGLKTRQVSLQEIDCPFSSTGWTQLCDSTCGSLSEFQAAKDPLHNQQSSVHSMSTT